MVNHRPVALAALLGAGLLPMLLGCASSTTAAPESLMPSGWPVDRSLVVVTTEFGAPRGESCHQGIDLAAPAGAAVHATADGRVIVAGREKRYGRMVLIDHGGGTLTRYAHLKRIEVARGDRVRRGDRIGRVGASGNASGPHLHYEVLRNGAPVNPRGYLEP